MRKQAASYACWCGFYFKGAFEVRMVNSSEPEFIKYVKGIILPAGFSFAVQAHADAYERLFTHDDALQKWQELYNTERKIQSCEGENDEDKSSTIWWNNLSKEEAWGFTGQEIANIFKHAVLPESRKITKAEIKKSANEAAKKAIELAHLINDHFNLQEVVLGDCFSDKEREAILHARDLYSDEFQIKAIEERSRLYSQYVAFKYQFMGQDLRDTLWRFSIEAEKTASLEPIKSKPKVDDLEANMFCTQLFSTFNYTYGKPLINIVISFADAVFDKQHEYETVKSWWQRSKDYSKVNEQILGANSMKYNLATHPTK